MTRYCCDRMNKAIDHQVIYLAPTGFYISGYGGRDELGEDWRIEFKEPISFCCWCGKKL